jgi:hypothetical protein
MRNKTISDETIRFLIAQKMSYVSATVNVCMQWWVSSIVFCGAVLAAVWLNQKELRQPGILIGLGLILLVFFCLIAYFGFSVAHRLGIVQQEIAALADKLHYADMEPILESRIVSNIKLRSRVSRWIPGRRLKSVKLEPVGGFFYTEIVTFKRSMRFGGGSFALICLAWIFLWGFLWAKRGENMPAVGATQLNQRGDQHDLAQPPPGNSPNPTPR